jgi:hypothetical protein
MLCCEFYILVLSILSIYIFSHHILCSYAVHSAVYTARLNVQGKRKIQPRISHEGTEEE